MSWFDKRLDIEKYGWTLVGIAALLGILAGSIITMLMLQPRLDATVRTVETTEYEVIMARREIRELRAAQEAHAQTIAVLKRRAQELAAECSKDAAAPSAP